MQSYTIDSNGNAVAPDGRVVGRRTAEGRLAMLPPEPDAAAVAAVSGTTPQAPATPPQIATQGEDSTMRENARAEAEGAPYALETPPAQGMAQKPPHAPMPGEMISLRHASGGQAASGNATSNFGNPAGGPSLSIPAPPSYTKYEVRPDTLFTVRFCLGFRDGRALCYTEDAKYKRPELESHWATFRLWTFREEQDWRNQTTVYDPPSRSWRPDPGRLNEIKLRHLLRDWSFAESDPKFRLLHVNGVLSDESYAAAMGLFPAILDNLLFLMNRVLEDNG